jgi:hypothetical protein
MLLIAVAMTAILLLAAGVVAFVAFPHRGHRMPVVPWLGHAMDKAANAMPTGTAPQDFYAPQETSAR